MKKNKYQFRWGGYKFAPESVGFTNFGKKLYFDTSNSMIKQNAVCGNRDKVEIELKQVVRKDSKKNHIFYTIGFRLANGNMIFFKELYTDNRFDLNRLYTIYKTIKNHFEKNKWYYQDFIIEHGVIDFRKNQEEERKDILVEVYKKPILIKMKVKNIYGN